MENPLIRIIAGTKVFKETNPWISTFLAELNPNENAAVLNLLIKEMGGLDEVLKTINPPIVSGKFYFTHFFNEMQRRVNEQNGKSNSENK